ncbi:hypothetical protein GCM10010306_100070 [Streptomyces umbrinus]|nr:hypothetical protein GCM10010306_100070 [Streptomyces umbrinus]
MGRVAPSVRAEGASTAVTASPPARVGMRVRITTGPELGPHREPDGGPFWVTMELFMRDTEGYRVAADESFLNERTVAGLYGVDETVRRLRETPSPPSSNVIRDADHFSMHRSASTLATMSALIEGGRCSGAEERSTRPSSPQRRKRLPQFDVYERAMPVSAAT